MAGIYIHIPYCKQACHYCNFHFSTSLKSRNDFVPALLKEMALRKEYLQGEMVDTIYFGGGTPSLLDNGQLLMIMESLYHHFGVSTGAEITLEANPDDIDLPKIKNWKQAAINRLSIGVQSFHDTDLQWMNRAHHAQQAMNSIRFAQDAGLPDISIDLIYGLPGFPDSRWRQNVETAVALAIPHLSCYALTVEPRTALQKMIATQKKENVNTADQARQFVLLMQWMEMAGYEHYEISNFAQPGKRSRHNSAYWQGKKYLGLGPSAHSYNGHSRQWNVAGNMQYIRAMEKNEPLFEKEELTGIEALNEYIMTRLRTMEGIDLAYLSNRFGAHIREAIEINSRKHIHDLKMKNENARLVLTREGKLFADGIAADLFFGE